MVHQIANTKVSIIVPVYNAESTVGRCVESILNQTHRNIEVVLVDDGSSDRSGSLCDKYAEMDDRVVAFHQSNSGVSSARNRGIACSTGDYIQFVDSDDYIEIDMTEILVREAESKMADVITCGYKVSIVDGGQTVERNHVPLADDLDDEKLRQAFAEIYVQGFVNSPCNKLYRASLIRDNHLWFRVGVDLGEDLLFNLAAVRLASHVSVVPIAPYVHVRDRAQSLTSKYRADSYECQRLIFEEVVTFLADIDASDQSISIVRLDYARNLLGGVIPEAANHILFYRYPNFRAIASRVSSDDVFESLSVESLKLGEPWQRRTLFIFLEWRLYFFIFSFAKLKKVVRGLIR